MKVFLFTSATCVPCKQMKKALIEAKIEFVEVDVVEDYGKLIDMNFPVSSVPTLALLTDDGDVYQVWNGFSHKIIQDIKDILSE